MNLTRWRPFREISLLRNRMSRPFDRALQGCPAAKNSARSWNPAVGFHESEDKVVIHIDLPAVDEATVEVRVENNILTIRGERRVQGSYEKGTLRPVEDGAFARSLTLATAVDPANVCTAYEAGVLTITLPKAQNAKPKRLEIAGAASA